MKTITIKLQETLRIALALLLSGGLYSNAALATASFSAQADYSLELTESTGLTVSVVDTFFDIFEAGIGDYSTTATGTAVPFVDAFGGDSPVAMSIGDDISVSSEATGIATTTPVNPASLAASSVLASAVITVDNPTADDGVFEFDLAWQWQSSLSIDHADELARIELQLLIGGIDEQGFPAFDDIIVYSVPLNTLLGDAGTTGDSGSHSFGSAVGAGGAWTVFVDLFAIDGRAESAVQSATIPQPVPGALLMVGAFGLYLARRRGRVPAAGPAGSS